MFKPLVLLLVFFQSSVFAFHLNLVFLHFILCSSDFSQVSSVLMSELNVIKLQIL